MTCIEESIYSAGGSIAFSLAAKSFMVARFGGWKDHTRFALVAVLGLGLASAARAEPQLPPDRFDIDVLTAYRYGLNHDWAPASCFGRISCPEDDRYSTRRDARYEDEGAH